jgi:hypothetical protein
VADYIFISNESDTHTKKAIQKATNFLAFVFDHHYPESYMTPLLESYQEIVWTTNTELYLLTRNDYFSRQEIKNALSEAIWPFHLTLPRYDWLITGDR